MTFTIGVLSDTHGLLRPEAIAALVGVDHILHAGDVGDPVILERLRSIAPLSAIRGNIDVFDPCASLPPTEAVEIHGQLFYLVHDIEDLDIDPVAAGVSAVIYGHSHRSEIRHQREVLYLNPGSAGPRRFRLPVTLAKISIDSASLIPEVIPLLSE